LLGEARLLSKNGGGESRDEKKGGFQGRSGERWKTRGREGGHLSTGSSSETKGSRLRRGRGRERETSECEKNELL